MTHTDIPEEIKRLTPGERLRIVAAAVDLIREDLANARTDDGAQTPTCRGG